MKDLKIAFIPLLRTTFDVELANQMIHQARKALIDAGFELTGPVEPVINLISAQAAARELASTPVDLILVFQATFADSTLVTILTENSGAPVFLWAVPEPWTGGRLRLNSLCGINLAGHALTLRKRKYQFAYGSPDNPTIVRKIRSFAAAGALYRRVRSARLGVVGEHPAGLDSCHLDESALYETFGVKVERLQLADVFTRARQVSAETIDQTRAHLDARLDNLASLDQTPLKGTLSVYNALKDISSEQNLDGLAVRCWPEFFTEMGCAACGAMSMLSDGFGQSTPVPCSCEADVNGTLTQLLLHWLSGSPAFGTDIVGIDEEEDRIALWHCGLAPLSMADPQSQPHGEIHSNRRLPLIMDFPLRPGTVTIARISRSAGNLRMILGRGEMLAEPKPFNGTAGTLKLEISAKKFFNILMREGLEHHISLVYGDFTTELQAYAELIELPVFPLGEEEVIL